jgi:hypothetical protein
VNPEVVSALFGMISRAPNLAGAACADPATRELFDEAAGVCSTEVVQEAAWACGRCPALATCRLWVEGLPPRQRPRGVVGGLVIASRTGRVVTAAAG